MKIAMIGHKRIPSREGGVEIVVEELVTRLVELGNNVTVYNRKGNNVQDKNADKEKRKLKEYKGVKIKEVFTFENKKLNAIVYTFNATIRALFGRYDVIHYHAEGPCSMIWLPHLFGIRTVATIHGLDWKRSKWGGFATKFLKFGEKCAAKYADEVIVLSEEVKKYFKETYNRDTIFIPNGVNKPIIREPEIIKEKWNLNRDDYILYLGRIVPEKGIHYLIEAFKEIDVNKKLVIAGGSSHTSEYLKEIKDLVKNDDRIIMTGFVQGRIIDELYSNASLYVLPSDLEGMPIALLEAMSYGCPVLTSNIEECIQVVGNYGKSFKKSDVNDLKKVLCENIKISSSRNELLSNYVIRKYNWDEITRKTMKIYQE